jgi:dihydrolipoamide dehydrogenase
MSSYDVIVLGSGPGGYVAAIRAAQNGLKTAIVEGDALGGVCLNWGCIPTKSLIESATLMRSIPDLERFGIKADRGGFSYPHVHKESRSVSEKLSRGVQHLLKTNGVEILHDYGMITSARHLRLVSTGQELEGSSLIIATGSREKEIPGFPFDGSSIVSSRDMLACDALPKDIAILGAGAVGVEFSYILAAFGVSVTLVELMEQVLPSEDAEVSVLIEKALKRQGVKIMTATKALSCAVEQGRVRLTLANEGKETRLSTEKLLVAVGRQPNTENIGLESAGIRTSRGFVVTGDYYETNVPGIYAIGDIAGQAMLAHVASHQGILVADHIAKKTTGKRIDDAMIPKAVYCEPQAASFGLTEKQAREKGLEVRVSRFPYRGCGKAVAAGKPEGFVKLLADSKTREILGASIVGMHATEIIHELLLAKTAELVPEDITRTIHAHPSFSETVMEASRGLFDKAIHI